MRNKLVLVQFNESLSNNIVITPYKIGVLLCLCLSIGLSPCFGLQPLPQIRTIPTAQQSAGLDLLVNELVAVNELGESLDTPSSYLDATPLSEHSEDSDWNDTFLQDEVEVEDAKGGPKLVKKKSPVSNPSSPVSNIDNPRAAGTHDQEGFFNPLLSLIELAARSFKKKRSGKSGSSTVPLLIAVIGVALVAIVAALVVHFRGKRKRRRKSSRNDIEHLKEDKLIAKRASSKKRGTELLRNMKGIESKESLKKLEEKSSGDHVRTASSLRRGLQPAIEATGSIREDGAEQSETAVAEIENPDREI